MKTSEKGDLGLSLVMADLAKKGYSLFLPVSSHLPFDLIAYKDGKFLRIQVKYRKDGLLSARRVVYHKGKVQSRNYQNSDFDYYALYLPLVEKVVYPSITFKGSKISCQVPNSPVEFYWYEDFLDFTNEAKKKTRKDFGYTYTYKPRNTRKVERPNAEELHKLVWSEPTTEIAKKFGVSDKAIEKWCKIYNIDKPPRGYWMKV